MDDALACIMLEAFAGLFFARVYPGNHKHSVALIHAPFDEGFFRVEIKDVELVDPRRHDEQGTFQHVLCLGFILDDLADFVLGNYLARCIGHILANGESRIVGLAQFEFAAAFGDVLGQHLHAAHQVFAGTLEGFAQDFRIGRREIGR